jgi:fatty acid synthase, animal type
MEKFLIANHKSSPIVISGISGRFPKSRTLRDFADNLYNKIDTIDDDESRWKHFNAEVPKRFGKISGLKKFDAQFFSYLDKHAATMDPQARMLLEHSYEAILDAGVCPQSLIGSRTGVFVAAMSSDSKDAFFHNIPTKEGHAMFGLEINQEKS